MDRFQDTKKASALGLVRSGLLKAIRPGVGWVWRARLRKRLPTSTDIWKASIGEQPLCQRENGNCADLFAVAPGCQKGSLGSSTFDRYWPCSFGRASAFYTVLFTSSTITRGTA